MTRLETRTSFIKVMVPLLDHMIATSITLPLEMLEAASTYSHLEGKKKTFQIHFCSPHQRPIKAIGGLILHPELTLNQTGQADLVIIPALWRNPMPMVKKHHQLVNWIRKQHDGHAIFAVGGTGVAFLAESGLLDGEPAATHWYYLERLQHRYPAVDFKPHHLITRAGHIYCAGSVNSVADLMVHLIKIAVGQSVALKVEQQFSHEIRKSYDETYFANDQVTPHRDEAIVLLQEWLQSHYQEEVTLADMERASGLKGRTLNRRFKQATNMPPVNYLKKLRLRQARELLKSTNLNIAEITLQVGYNSPDYFSRLFLEQYQLSPTDFRKSVREKLFQLND
ncbi:helix-turn-helix domain-containing protein [Endozoicomonas sp. Mp262]|uniref:GlxA family transcriptional regulator n=1 Tax=Endozoicomonas sp. Mp262 TaxID=2919499 RepID=UPI0021DB1F21